MSVAVYALAVDSCLAMLFVIAYGVVSLSHVRERASRWFLLGYALCCATTICQLLNQLNGPSIIIALIGYGAFLGTVIAIWAGIEVMGGRAPPRAQATAIWGAGMALRLALLFGTPRSLPYEILFQLPFALMSLRSMLAVRHIRRRGPLASLLIGIFAVIGLHFAAKPFLAVSLIAAVRDAAQVYAVVSSVSTGVLLVAAGLFLLLLVIQKALEETIVDSETDALTGLANRRALSRIGSRLLDQAGATGWPLYAMVLDLDHFKRVNDTWGHAMGDAVLIAFADILRHLAPSDTLVVRMGGEEFALLMPVGDMDQREGEERAMHLGQGIRHALRSFPERGLPEVTVSGGIACYRSGETLDAWLGRADQGAYRAKQCGRDQIRSDRDQAPAERTLTRAA